MITIEEELSKNIKNMVIQIQNYNDSSLLNWVTSENINLDFTTHGTYDTTSCKNLDIIKKLVEHDNHNDESFIFCLRNARSILKQ